MTEGRKTSNWPEPGRFWTAPNLLSMVRLVLVFPVVWLILVDGRLLWIMILVVLAVATDYFDGRVARWSKTESAWGKVLDPLADKLAGGLVVLALVIRGMLPTWFVVLILARDLTILGGGVLISRRTGEVPASMWAGKVAVTATAITILAALLKADPEVLRFCVYATTVLLAWSFLGYMGRYLRIMARGPRRNLAVGEASDGG
jgi:CDP-diacylglycerol--glycerol-3-phosphate 3-phosphatidyltransferase